MNLIFFFIGGQGANSLTENLLRRINETGKVHMVPTTLRGQFVLRFAVCHAAASEDHVEQSWAVIAGQAERVLFKQEVAAEKIGLLFRKHKENKARRAGPRPRPGVLGELKKNGAVHANGKVK